MMLTSIHIKNFKSFKDTKIESLRKVNLILGGQNVGKTSLLEAVWLGTTHKNDIVKLPSIFRRIDMPNDVRYFFYGIFNLNDFSILANEVKTFIYDKSGKELKERYKKTFNEEAKDEIKEGVEADSNEFVIVEGFSCYREHDFNFFSKSLPISITLPSEFESVDLFGKVFGKRKKKNLIQLLQKIEPRLEDINTSNLNGEWRIYVDIDGNSSAVPISYMGHGFNRLFHLYCSLLETDAKLTLIDEIENGIYYAALPTLFKGIQQIATNNDIQSLITTHSWECICAAYNVFAEAGRLEDFQLIRLEQEGDNVRAVLINDEDLDTIMEAGHEIR